MKIITALLSSFFVVSAWADCVDDYRYLHNKEEVKIVEERTIEIMSKKLLKYLIEPESKVVADYMKLTDFSFDGDNGLAITTEQYRDRLTGLGIGYRISVTDGSDFSRVRYVVKIEEGRKNWQYPILHRVQEGRRRVSEYICE